MAAQDEKATPLHLVSTPTPGLLNQVLTVAAAFCMALAIGGLVNVVLKLVDHEWIKTLSAFGSTCVFCFLAVFVSLQTTWGRPRISRFLPPPRDRAG